jgi:Flp pilus assembly pilin Flp
MTKNKFWKKAQSMTEYAVIIATVAAALAAMGVFFKAGLQKKLFGLTHELSDRPYFPRMTTSSSQGTAGTTTNENYRQGVSDVSYNETSSKTGAETVSPETE